MKYQVLIHTVKRSSPDDVSSSYLGDRAITQLIQCFVVLYTHREAFVPFTPVRSAQNKCT